LRQSAAHLKEYLSSAKRAAGAAGVRDPRAVRDVRILGIASLHRAQAMPAANDVEQETAEAASRQLCSQFLRRLAALGEAR
jgi:hypothetical protein